MNFKGQIKCTPLVCPKSAWGGSSEINGAGVDGFGVACPTRARGVLGNRLEEVDVTVASSADGRWEGVCSDEKGAELSTRLEVVFDIVDRHGDDIRHGRSRPLWRRFAAAAAMAMTSASSSRFKIVVTTVRLRRG